MSYQAPPQQLPAAQPPQPSNPPHGAHTLNSGPQPGTAPATQHSQAGPAPGQAYGPHSYPEAAKPKKGQQLWNRMKRKLALDPREDRAWGLHLSGLGPEARWGGILISGCVMSQGFECSHSAAWPVPFLGVGQPQAGPGCPNPSFCCPHSSPWDWWSQVQHSEAALCRHQPELHLCLGGPAQQLRPPAQPREGAEPQVMAMPLPPPRPLASVLSVCVQSTGTFCTPSLSPLLQTRRGVPSPGLLRA